MAKYRFLICVEFDAEDNDQAKGMVANDPVEAVSVCVDELNQCEDYEVFASLSRVDDDGTIEDVLAGIDE